MRSLLLRYGVALFAVGLAVLIRLLAPMIGDATPFLLAFTVILVAVWYGGWWPGVAATLALALFMGCFVLSPMSLPHGEAKLVRLVVFVLLSGLICAIVEAQRRAEEALRTSEARLAGIIRSAMDAIITVDEEQRVLVFNTAAEQMFRCSAAEAIGRPIDRFIPERFRHAHQDHIRAFGKTGTTTRTMRSLATLMACRADGEEFPIEATISQIEVAGQKLYSVILRDITERQRLEDELRCRADDLAEADQRKDDFLAILAHELRNPLAPLRNAVEVLKRSAPSDACLARVREIVERQVTHQARLLDDLLDVSRIVRGKITLSRDPLDLGLLLRDTVEDSRSFLEAAGLSLSLELPKEPVWVLGDPTRLAQVVGNLLHNAAKFTEPGGSVTVSLAIRESTTEPGTRGAGGRHGGRLAEGEWDEEDEAGVSGSSSSPSAPSAPSSPSSSRSVPATRSAGTRLRGEKSRAVVTVSDTGVGIEPELLPHVFETFTQADHGLDRRRGGLGLGLALAKGLVELHGGEVRAQSEGTGRGAEFTLWLPTIPPPVPAAEAPAAPASLPRSLRVLIVEDSRDAAETMRELLELSGCAVAVAGSGPEAVELAGRFRPEVVLCDLGLPGMDGYEVAAELRRNPGLEETRLIAITGYGQEEDRHRSRAAGFDVHLTKPVAFDELERLLDGHHVRVL